MSDRDAIFGRIQSALADLPADKKTAHPAWETELALSRHVPEVDAEEAHVDRFCERLTALHGHPLDGWAALAGFLAAHESKNASVDPALAETVRAHCPDLTLHPNYERADVDRYDVGITRAVAGVAETGTFILADRVTSARLGFFAPWVHVAVLEKAAIVDHLPAALAQLDDDPYLTLVTGPSKTADIEGVLIEGVHGPGVQACLLI